MCCSLLIVVALIFLECVVVRCVICIVVVCRLLVLFVVRCWLSLCFVCGLLSIVVSLLYHSCLCFFFDFCDLVIDCWLLLLVVCCCSSLFIRLASLLCVGCGCLWLYFRFCGCDY